jgi:hypothetical protein
MTCVVIRRLTLDAKISSLRRGKTFIEKTSGAVRMIPLL